MSKQYWFSATLRFYVVSATQGRVGGEDSVYLTRAADLEDAFQKFLAIGRRREAYAGDWAQDARERFVAVTLMDKVGDIDLDGVEISCTPLFEEDPTFTLDTPLDPANTVPEQTGIMPAKEDDESA